MDECGPSSPRLPPPHFVLWRTRRRDSSDSEGHTEETNMQFPMLNPETNSRQAVQLLIGRGKVIATARGPRALQFGGSTATERSGYKEKINGGTALTELGCAVGTDSARLPRTTAASRRLGSVRLGYSQARGAKQPRTRSSASLPRPSSKS